MAVNLPSGTVTFLFTDIEKSLEVAQAHPEAWESLREHQTTVLRSAIERHRGRLFQVVGDACCAAFDTVGEAVAAAVQAQCELGAEMTTDVPIRVRMGIHTGEAQPQGDSYRGYLTLARAQRIMSAAHGEQILVSNSSAELLRRALPAEASLRDRGELRLRGLLQAEHVWQMTAPGLREDFPPPASPAARPNNLPIQLTSFFGREVEIAAVRRLLKERRMVTLTGAGGIGKTRLALQVAAQLLDEFSDGVWFVELAPLSDPSLVPNAVAAVLGVREVQGRPVLASVLESLQGKQALLLVDNCEHLLEGCAGFADTVLHASREPRLLATSREPLGIGGEVTFRVPSLDCPEPSQASQIPSDELLRFAAVQLFSERAKESLSTFSMTRESAAAVAQICHRLDGIPLALELAAARVRSLRPSQIASRLDDCFGLLTSGGRTDLPRHQTLRALIDWSHDLLTEPERILLRRLSVFAGGWTLEAAEGVCSGEGIEAREVMDLLGHLVDKSLVLLDETSSEPRYRMLETIREYARERLSQSDEEARLRNQHLNFTLRLAEQADANFHSQQERLWLDRLELEIDNLRAALEWASGLEQPEAGLQLAGLLYWFWWTRGYWQEANRWLREMLGKAGADKPTKGQSKALIGMAWFMSMAGDPDAARAMGAEAVSISRAVRDRRSLAESLTVLGQVISVDDYTTADAMFEEGLALSRELGYKQGILAGLVGLGNCRVLRGKDDEARPYYEEATGIMRQAGDKAQLAYVVRRMAYLALRRSQYHEAMDLCIESLSLNEEMRDQRGMAAALATIGCIACRRGDTRRAARLYGASVAVVNTMGGKLIPNDLIDNQPFIDAARARLGDEEYNRRFGEGMMMPLEKAVAYALDEGAA